jgi:drug/metabolite transporter (DMT)-like permease
MPRYRFNNFILYIVPTMIWGSTWLAIKYQLGTVDPILSVFYRFFAAGFLLLLLGLWRRWNFTFSRRQHLFIGLQGITLFGVNYWLVYTAELVLTSGLVAVLFSLLIFTNLFIGAAVLGTPVQWQTIVGACLGIGGTALLFVPEFASIDSGEETVIALVMGLVSVLLASVGNVLSGYNQRSGVAVPSGNALAMIYGALSLLPVIFIRDVTWHFDFRLAYVASFLYLLLFGSIIAFSAYLTLLGRIGPHKAAYVPLLVPIIAMLLSSLYENYHWNYLAAIGLLALLAGNYLVLRARSQRLVREDENKTPE